MTLGNHPTIIYMDEPPASGGPDIRYDVTAASKAEILNTAVSEAQDPARSSAASMNGLWKVNADGTGLTRLAAAAGKQGQFAVFSHAAWANVSRDASLYAF
jgi:hypothetical protein